MNKNKVQKRIFLVGAARSGTTLLQSMLSSHTKIYSFPETHFFSATIPREKWKKLIWTLLPKNNINVKKFLNNIGERELVKDLNKYLPTYTLSIKKWVAGAINILDILSINQGYYVWLEKTPMHLYYIDLISSVFPQTTFIHIIRNGEDVVASMYEVTQKHPENWGGPRNIEKCIERWKNDINISKKYIGHPNHNFVIYENLLSNPTEILSDLLSQLDLKYEKEILNKYKNQSLKLILSEESWKENAKKDIIKSEKFERNFSREEQTYIKNMISDVDLGVFNKGKK